MRGGPIACPVHVGRQGPVEVLARSASDARRGTAPLLCISGEAGVGKSRMASEAVAIAAESGMACLVGETSPDAGVPYGPFSSLLRRYTRAMADDELADLFSGRRTLAAMLLPEVAAELGLAGRRPEPDDLFAAIWQLLAKLCRPGGTLMLLEDIHWADVDSLRLLAYLARETTDLPLWMVATYRSDELHRRHPLLPVLGELNRERRIEEVALSPLGRDDVAAMLSAIFDGASVSAEFVDAIVERTEGNPFFVEELARTLVDQGDVYREGAGWGRRSLQEIALPLSVREALLTRFRALPAPAREVLGIAACAGDRVDPAVLQRAVGDRDAVEQALREALDCQLLVDERLGLVTRYRFRHALTREAVADDVVGPARQRAHSQVAQALEAVHHADLDAVAAELADHLERAGQPERAGQFALRAARRAVAAGAVDEAARWFDAALRLEPPDPSVRLDRLLEAAAGTLIPQNPRLAGAYAEEAVEVARQVGDLSGEAEACWTLQRVRYQLGDSRGAITVLERALGLVHGRDDEREAVTLGQLTRLYVLADRPAEAEPELDRGEALARKTGQHVALAQILGTRLLMARPDEDATALFGAGMAAARAANDPYLELNMMANWGYTSAWCGSIGRAIVAMRDALDIGRRLRPGSITYIEAGLAWAHSLAGDYPRVRELAEPIRSDPAIPSRLVALTALTEVAERCEGDAVAWALLEEQEDAARQTDEAQRMVPVLGVRARLTTRRDGIDRALPLFREVLSRTVNQHGRGSHWMFSPEAAWSLAAEGRLDDLERWVADIGALTAHDAHAQNRAADRLCQGAYDHAVGELDRAAGALETAVGLFAAMPYPARQLEALAHLADVRLVQGRVEDAAAIGRAAFQEATGLGAAQLVELASDLLDRAEGGSVVATVMVTDIVGSTERAAALGDLAWSELLARHHAAVRREVARFGGREIDTAGDGFLVTFDSPARAVRCAVAVVDAVAGLGAAVRVGVHTGECRRAGAKLTGLAVHIGSRVASEAGPGEVLVSGTVTDLVAGSGIRFAERGERQLRGVPGSWRVFAVVS